MANWVAELTLLQMAMASARLQTITRGSIITQSDSITSYIERVLPQVLCLGDQEGMCAEQGDY